MNRGIVKKSVVLLTFALSLCRLSFSAYAEEHFDGQSETSQKLVVSAPQRPMKPEVLGGSKVNAAIVRARSKFYLLYHEMWNAMRMEEKLAENIDKAVTDEMQSMLWGTRKLRLALRSRHQERIVGNVAASFGLIYEEMVENLLSELNDIIQKQSVDLYRGFVRQEHVEPAVKAQLDKIAAGRLADDGQKLNEAIGEKLAERFNDVQHVGSTKFDALSTGTITAFLVQRLMKRIATRTAGKFLGSSIVGLVGTLATPVGYFMAAWTVWDVTSSVWGVEEKLRQNLKDSFTKRFKRDMVDEMWDQLKLYVQSGYEEVYLQFSADVDAARELARLDGVQNGAALP